MGFGQISIKKNIFVLQLSSILTLKKRNDQNQNCSGYWRNYNCVYGVGNWAWLMRSNRTRLFANKFDCNAKNSSDLVTKIEDELFERENFDF